MLRQITLLTALLLPASAIAAAPTLVSGERDGMRFQYAAELMPSGQVRISGNMLPSHESFDYLVEASGLVHGQYAYSPIEFYVEPAKHDRLVAELTAAPSLTAAAANTLQAIATAAR